MRMDSASMIIPLQTDEHGVIRASGTRVTLDSIINYYRQGQIPEALHEGFPTVPLIDIYALIAYYLANRDELDTYLKHQEAHVELIRQEFEAKYPPKVTRAELLKRRDAKQNEQDT